MGLGATEMNVAAAVASILKAEGTEYLFCFPINPLIDECARIGIRPIVARTERTLLNMAEFGAMISYALQGVSFILLRRNMPDIERPYRSPLGVPGAAATVVIASVTLYYQLQDPLYRKGVYAAVCWYIAGVIYFALVGRHRLVLSPEEEFALTHGEHGHPEHEGYGTTKL